MDKKLFSLLIILFLTLCAYAQDNDIPYNLNRAYIKGVDGYTTIKVTTTYDSGDYRAESFHYYNNINQNYLTVTYFKDSLQSRYYFDFDGKGRLVKETKKGMLVRDWDKDHLDTSKVYWTTIYDYHPNGKIKTVNNTWFNESGPESRTVILYRYDAKWNILEEETINYDLDSLTSKVYFEPNSVKLAEVQNLPSFEKSTKKYIIEKDKTIIENYRGGKLKTRATVLNSGKTTTETLADLSGKTIRVTTISYNSLGKKIKEEVRGNKDISDFEEYGDGYGNELISYDYNKMHQLSMITYGHTAAGQKQFVKFQDYKELLQPTKPKNH